MRSKSTFAFLLLGQLLLLVLVLVLCDGKESSGSSSSRCKQSCGSSSVPYPFGFSTGCPIQLDCSASSSSNTIPRIQLYNTNNTKNGEELEVRNITSEHLLVHLPPSCNRSLSTTLSALFSTNYAISSTNALFLQGCTPNNKTSTASSCTVPTSVLSRHGVVACPYRNVTCLDPTTHSPAEFLQHDSITAAGCRLLFTSVGYEGNELFPATVQLGWWLEGRCRCSDNANCTTLRSPPTGKSAFRCTCHHGFQGDGFTDGTACRKVTVSKCNPSKYISGECGEAVQIGLLITGIVFGAAMMAGICVVCYLVRRRSACLRRQRNTKRLLSEASCAVPLYSYSDIKRATDGFSDAQRLGTGAYGTVYAGRLSNNRLVAIKKIKQRDNGSIEQVMNEVKLVSSVSHPNLVRLLGWCIEGGEQILVYEFVPNGTLAQHLQRERGPALPWTVRLRIAAETAKGIAYLHSVVFPPIYHRDIKSSNILLDFNFNSKVADFGLSRMGMTSDSSHISTAPQGTPGYVDPQYHQNFQLSDKSDVYSFGVVLVEIITALKAVDLSRAQNEVNLAQLAVDKIGKGNVDDIIDPCLEPHSHSDAWTLASIHKVAELAFRCLAFHREMRPSMTEVADELEQIQISGWASSADDGVFMLTTSPLCSSSPSNGTDKSWPTSDSKSKRKPVLLVNAVAEETDKGVAAVGSPVSLQVALVS